MKTARPYWAIPLTMICMFVQVYAVVLPMELLGLPRPLFNLAAGLGITLVAILLVAGWRRYLLRRSWAGVGLSRSRSAFPQALLGVAAAAAAVAAANAASVALGAATWAWPDLREATAEIGFGMTVLAILGSLSVSILWQGLPEELLWRGHLHELLSSSMSPGAVLLLTSMGFGSLHIFSSSGADGMLERLLWVVTATALGFAAGAARARTGAVWMAVGVHSGLHIANGLLAPVEPSNFVAWVVMLTIALTIAGLVILGRSLWRPSPSPSPRPTAATSPFSAH